VRHASRQSGSCDTIPLIPSVGDRRGGGLPRGHFATTLGSDAWKRYSTGRPDGCNVIQGKMIDHKYLQGEILCADRNCFAYESRHIVSSCSLSLSLPHHPLRDPCFFTKNPSTFPFQPVFSLSSISTLLRPPHSSAA
jgi:hypothetical protein